MLTASTAPKNRNHTAPRPEASQALERWAEALTALRDARQAAARFDKALRALPPGEELCHIGADRLAVLADDARGADWLLGVLFTTLQSEAPAAVDWLVGERMPPDAGPGCL